MFFGHFLTSLDDGGDVLFRRVAHKLQGQVYLVGFYIINILLVLKVFLQSLNHSWKFRAAWDGDSEEGSFRSHNS
jgi:hypothetical protein